MKDKELKERIINAADAVTIDLNGKTFKEYREQLTQEMNTTKEQVKRNRPELSDGVAEQMSDQIRNNAIKAAGTVTQELLTKVLYQELNIPSTLTQFSFINVFDDVVLEAGNGKEYIFKPITGMSEYNRSTRVENTEISPKVRATTADMYHIDGNGNETLAPNSYKFRKFQSINRYDWLPYFTSGKLDEFIAEIVSAMRVTYSYFKAHTMLQSIMVDTQLAINKAAGAQANRDGSITLVEGNASNMFAAIATDIMSIITSMQLGEPKYAYGKNNNDPYTDAIISSSPEDLIMIVPDDFKTKLAMLNSTLPSQKIVPLSNYINESNIIALGSQLSIPGAKNVEVTGTGTNATVTTGKVAGNENNEITKDLTKKYVPDDCVIIFDKRYIKHLLQIDVSTSQEWAANLLNDIFIHVWGTYKILPWAPIVVYKNPNLLTLPAGAN